MLLNSFSCPAKVSAGRVVYGVEASGFALIVKDRAERLRAFGGAVLA
jgi:hypothetical protein